MVEKSAAATKEKTLEKAVQKEEKLSADIFASVQDTAEIADRLASAKVPEKISKKEGKEAGEKVQLFIDAINYLNEAGHMKRVSNMDPIDLRMKMMDEADRKKAESEKPEAKAMTEFLGAASNELAIKYINTLEGIRTLAKDGTPESELERLQAELVNAARDYDHKLRVALEQNEKILAVSGRKRTAEEETLKKTIETQRVKLGSTIKVLAKSGNQLPSDEIRRVAVALMGPVQKLKTYRPPTAQDIINNTVEKRTKELLDEYEKNGDLNALRKKTIVFQEAANKRIRESSELAPIINMLDELYHFGTIKGGIVGGSRISGTISEKAESGWRGFAARIPGQGSESKLLLQAFARASGTTDMDLAKKTLWALENKFGRNWEKIVVNLADSFLNAIPSANRDKKTIFAYLDKVIAEMMTVRGDAKVASIVRTALTSGLLASTGNRDWDNKREDVVKNLLQPNLVTRSMAENMNTYIYKMYNGWAKPFFEKNKRDWQEIDDSIKTFLTDGATYSPEKRAERYMHIFKLINLIWVETHISDIETRNPLLSRLVETNSILDAQAMSRMLMDQYLRNVKTSVFKFSEKELKLLEKSKERNRNQMEYLTGDELWRDIQAKILKKLKEQESEKGKVEEDPYLV